MGTRAGEDRGTLSVSVDPVGPGPGEAAQGRPAPTAVVRDEFWAREVLFQEGFGMAEIQDLAAEDLFELAYEAAGL